MTRFSPCRGLSKELRRQLPPGTARTLDELLAVVEIENCLPAWYMKELSAAQRDIASALRRGLEPDMQHVVHSARRSTLIRCLGQIGAIKRCRPSGEVEYLLPWVPTRSLSRLDAVSRRLLLTLAPPGRWRSFADLARACASDIPEPMVLRKAGSLERQRKLAARRQTESEAQFEARRFDVGFRRILSARLYYLEKRGWLESAVIDGQRHWRLRGRLDAGA